MFSLSFNNAFSITEKEREERGRIFERFLKIVINGMKPPISFSGEYFGGGRGPFRICRRTGEELNFSLCLFEKPRRPLWGSNLLKNGSAPRRNTLVIKSFLRFVSVVSSFKFPHFWVSSFLSFLIFGDKIFSRLLFLGFSFVEASYKLSLNIVGGWLLEISSNSPLSTGS